MRVVKVSEVSGVVLDWLVAKCEWVQWTFEASTVVEIIRDCRYSTDWAQGGLIIERELDMLVKQDSGQWLASVPNPKVAWYLGPTPLIAAMRCYVASKLGETVEVPDELFKSIN